MTRFLLSLDEAVDTVFAAVARRGRAKPMCRERHPRGSWTWRPRSSATGRSRQSSPASGPGEKIHEIMVSEEEAYRTVERGRWYAILPDAAGSAR